MRDRPAGRLDAMLLVSVAWVWGVTGVVFWGLAEDLGAVLPFFPRAVWAGPGMLWRLAPGALVALLAAVPFLVGRRRPDLRPFRPLLVVTLGVVAIVALVWGGALIAASRSA